MSTCLPDTALCFSHLRWDFVYQRPQHLMSRLAVHSKVLFIEEPIPCDGPARLEIRRVTPRIEVVVPRLAARYCTPGEPLGETLQLDLLDALLQQRGIDRPLLWYYTPMSLAFSSQIPASLIVYDCMDELRAFDGASKELPSRERCLLAAADLVFTGGRSLFALKRARHPHVHLFPSSVDAAHFARARSVAEDPPEFAGIGYPRIGFHGVIDERLDVQLLAEVARARPHWQWILVGPVVKIPPERLPRGPNLHYLGAKTYATLPNYIGRWDVAMLPFAMNDATRYISPTKTPEYLAAGCAVVSTPVRDVVHAWGESGLVAIAADAPAFLGAVQAALDSLPARSAAVCARADQLLEGLSWNRSFDSMWSLIRERLAAARPRNEHAGRLPAANLAAGG